MNKSPVSLTTHIVQKFTEVHQIDERTAYIQLISGFCTCISVMNPEQRIACVSALIILLKDISLERFEDGNDFASFMKEKAEEHRLKGDFEHDKDADSQ